jgi:TRAP-type C4-dicarboxylate transport system substrate-binding protein
MPAAGKEAMLQAAAEAGKQIKADGRRESEDSIEALKKRGLKIHQVTPDAAKEWQQEVEAAYPKIRGGSVPADVYDEIVKELQAFRAAQGSK